MTTHQILKHIEIKLKSVAGDCALAEAERILEFLLGCSRSELYLSSKKTLPAEAAAKIETMVKRRLTDEPLAYILGSVYFYNREFIITPDVLIPRPDTETLVEEVLKNEPAALLRFLDLGTGSGCIAAALAQERPSWRAVASDISPSALAVAQRNCPGAVALFCGDRFSALKPFASFDVIATNPPYIPAADRAALPRSVRCFEPRGALDGGNDGLAFYRYLAAAAPALLRESGRIYCEIGFDQGASAPGIFETLGWRSVSVTTDLSGRPRLVRAVRPQGLCNASCQR